MKAKILILTVVLLVFINGKSLFPAAPSSSLVIVYNCADHQQFTVGVVSIVILEPYNKEAMCGIEGFICVQVSGTIMFLSENPTKKVTPVFILHDCSTGEYWDF